MDELLVGLGNEFRFSCKTIDEATGVCKTIGKNLLFIQTTTQNGQLLETIHTSGGKIRR